MTAPPDRDEIIAEMIESAFRPRDDFDVDVHPDSLRGQVLAYHDAYAAIPWWLRTLARVMAWRPCR